MTRSGCDNYQTLALSYYDSKLSLDYNLDKDLSKRGKDNQLVKHQDIGLYLQLYIYKKIERYS